ncbi:MAG TPA: MCP four helix bundle domain-containing protein, partial [Aquabacterium sp.]|nr:MCP four helix bundle domain-containing protein [Aquabacterium sp.]
MSATDLMRRFSIRARMRGSMALVLALLALLGDTGLVCMHRMQGLYAEFQHHSVSETRALSDVREALGQVRRHEKDLMLASGQPSEIERHRQSWLSARQRLDQAIAQMLTGEEDEDNPVLRKVNEQLQPYHQAMLAMIPQLSQGSLSGSQALAQSRAILAQIDQIDSTTEQLDKILQEEAQHSQDEQQQALETTEILFIGTVALAVIVAIPLTWLNEVSICQPIDQARAVAQRITQGHLSGQIDTQGSDEASQLLRALDLMQASLQRLVG